MAIEKNLYDQTDWELLRRQKLALIETEAAHRGANLDTELLVGLLHFIDCVQDDAEGKGYPVFDIYPVLDAPTIVADCNVQGHRTAKLPDSLTVAAINKRLGFKPNVADDPSKVTHSWGMTIDGHECAIWDYKGARWSAYDPDGVLGKVFPELVKG